VGIVREGFEGLSLIDLMEARKPAPVKAYVTCETNDFGVKEEEQTIAVRTKRMKYIHNIWKQGENLFFDLQEDPRERRPMFSSVGDRSKELTYFYQEWRSHYKTGRMSAKVELDKETKEALKSLGYLK